MFYSSQLCLTFCHLISLGDQTDLSALNNAMAGYTETLNESLKTVSVRVSPEKASTFIETKRLLASKLGPKNENLFEIFSGLDSYICC